MDIEQFKQKMATEVDAWTIGSGTRSRAFLKWFLVNYFRIDEDQAVDYVCDNTNDKGIDGIYVDDLSSDMFIFQSKYSPTAGGDQGDNDLKTFDGVKAWFESTENVQSLDDSLANQELKAIITRLELTDKIKAEYNVNLIFLTNKIFDQNGREYLGVAGEYFDAWDLNRLHTSYTYAGRDRPIVGKFSFPVEQNDIIQRNVAGNVDAVVFIAKASDIVKLDGIQDQTLFDKNVRYWLGKTRINREIAKTIRNPSDHDSFLLFNNGITIICEKFDLVDAGSKLDIENYAVVNGCQTVLTLYENKDFIDDRVSIFVRLIKTGDNEQLSKRITFYNNNQNAISARDLKSNDKIQQDIQKQVLDYFNNKILYTIKRGEAEEGYEVVIPNDFVAQLIASFALKESFTAHQKTKIFEDNYQHIFSRHISPPLIFLFWRMYENINNNCVNIENPGARDYKTTRFFFMYVFREIFDKDEVGSTLIAEPDSFYKTFSGSIDDAFDKLSKILVIAFNSYVKTQQENGQYFDYKNILRNEKLTKDMASDIISKYETVIIFQPEGKVANLLGS